MKKTDFSERLKNERKTAEDKGKTIGMEVRTKDFIAGLGIDIDKSEAIDKIVEAAKTKIVADAKIAPAEKEKEWLKEKAILNGNIERLTGEKTSLETGYKQEREVRQINESIIGKMPKKGMVLEPERLAVLFKQDYTPELVEGKVVFRKDGEILKNGTTQNPLTIEELLPDWQKPFVGKASGGKGGDDEPGTGGGGANEWDDFVKEMEGKGHKVGTKEFNEQRRARKIKPR